MSITAGVNLTKGTVRIILRTYWSTLTFWQDQQFSDIGRYFYNLSGKHFLKKKEGFWKY